LKEVYYAKQQTNKCEAKAPQASESTQANSSRAKQNTIKQGYIMSNFLKDMVKTTGNEFASIVEDGIDGGDVTGFVDTGVYALNALLSGSLYGGMPANKIMALAGESATGKTFFALSIVKTFLEANPDGVCMYFDSEAAVTSDMFRTRNIDTRRVAVIGVATVEEFRNQAVKVVDNYLKMPAGERKPMIMILDSLGMLSSSKEMNDTAEGKDTRDMTRAQVTKATFRVLTLKLGKAGIPLIMTNHTYETMSMFPQKVMGGGTGLRYAASTVLFLSKRKEKIDNEVVGNVIHCKLDKGRFTKENMMVDVLLRYDTGLNKYYGLLPIAEKHGIFKKVSTRYEMPDGSKAFEKNINENPEKYYTDDVMRQLEDAVAKEFKYGNEVSNDEQQS
jgi:RecA/RadA recombinase